MNTKNRYSTYLVFIQKLPLPSRKRGGPEPCKVQDCHAPYVVHGVRGNEGGGDFSGFQMRTT